jgi:hypothetical protein
MLKSDFDAFRMQEGETLDQYAGKLLACVSGIAILVEL